MVRALFLLYAIWGFNWVVMKTANAYFPPVLFVAFRFLIGSAVMLSVCAWRRLPIPERKYWKWIAATGILQIAVNNVCMQIGMYSLTAGVVSVLNYTMPVWMAMLAQLFLKEKLTFRKMTGIAICIVGLFVLMDIHDLGNMTAVFIVLAGAAAWAASGIILKRHLQDTPPLPYSAWQMVVGSLLLFVVSLIVPQPPIHWTTTAAACLLYNGILGCRCRFLLMELSPRPHGSRQGRCRHLSRPRRRRHQRYHRPRRSLHVAYGPGYPPGPGRRLAHRQTSAAALSPLIYVTENQQIPKKAANLSFPL